MRKTQRVLGRLLTHKPSDPLAEQGPAPVILGALGLFLIVTSGWWAQWSAVSPGYGCSPRDVMRKRRLQGGGVWPGQQRVKAGSSGHAPTARPGGGSTGQRHAVGVHHVSLGPVQHAVIMTVINVSAVFVIIQSDHPKVLCVCVCLSVCLCLCLCVCVLNLFLTVCVSVTLCLRVPGEINQTAPLV